MFSASKLAEKDGLRELSWGPVWEEAEGEEAVETVRRTWPEQRQKRLWRYRDLLPINDVQKGMFSMKLERKFSPHFLIYLEIIQIHLLPPPQQKKDIFQ